MLQQRPIAHMVGLAPRQRTARSAITAGTLAEAPLETLEARSEIREAQALGPELPVSLDEPLPLETQQLGSLGRQQGPNHDKAEPLNPLPRTMLPRDASDMFRVFFQSMVTESC
jgi:hypothetical protein